jgi:formylglycine-generating enzyme required for sulfatase activity
MSLRGRPTTANGQRSRNLSKQRADYFPRKAFRVEGKQFNFKKMKQNYKIYLCALLLVGAVNTMTIGALGADKPTLAVFVVGMQTDALGNDLAQKIGDDLNRNSRYTVLSSAADPVKAKLTELRTQGARSIDRNELASWGRANGVSTICLVTDDIKGSDNMFSALLIDAKDSKVSGRGSYIRTGVVSNDLPRVSLALSRQLDGPERRHATPAPVRRYPAELDIEMVFVEGGTFTMGCTPEQVNYCNNDGREKPAHSVTVSSFYIGKYEVTRAQWIAVMSGHKTLANPGTWKSDDQLPIEGISWDDIDTAFLPRLNALTGRTTVGTKYRLPREAEWEYAARGCKGDGKGGTATCENFLYSGSNNLNEVGWYGGSQPRIVGGKKPNILGIYDMSGNIMEWCKDTYTVNYYSTTPMPKDPENTVGTNHPCRGGSWLNTADRSRVADRGFAAPNLIDPRVGFRLALPAQ